MDKKTAERERKELNKRLLKKSFVSDIKSKKKLKSTHVINFVAIFVGLLLSEWITGKFSIDNGFIEIIISVVLILALQFLGELLIKGETNYE